MEFSEGKAPEFSADEVMQMVEARKEARQHLNELIFEIDNTPAIPNSEKQD